MLTDKQIALIERIAYGGTPEQIQELVEKLQALKKFKEQSKK